MCARASSLFDKNQEAAERHVREKKADSEPVVPALDEQNARGFTMRRLSFLLVALALLWVTACNKKAETDGKDPKPATNSAAEEAKPADPEPGTEETPAAAPVERTLVGRVQEMPWSKDFESWDAGATVDTEYYVLRVEGSTEAPILRFSEQVPFEKFAEFEGKRVEVVGTDAVAKTYVPKGPGDVYPMDKNGVPAPRGSGFIVKFIVEKE